MRGKHQRPEERRRKKSKKKIFWHWGTPQFLFVCTQDTNSYKATKSHMDWPRISVMERSLPKRLSHGTAFDACLRYVLFKKSNTYPTVNTLLLR
jgi:hypothetical protein